MGDGSFEAAAIDRFREALVGEEEKDAENKLYVKGNIELSSDGSRYLNGSSDLFYLVADKRSGRVGNYMYKISLVNASDLTAEKLEEWKSDDRYEVEKISQKQLLEELHQISGFTRPDEWEEREGDEE